MDVNIYTYTYTNIYYILYIYHTLSISNRNSYEKRHHIHDVIVAPFLTSTNCFSFINLCIFYPKLYVKFIAQKSPSTLRFYKCYVLPPKS